MVKKAALQTESTGEAGGVRTRCGVDGGVSPFYLEFFFVRNFEANAMKWYLLNLSGG